MNAPFKFKQFTIEQDRCAMKIGTDGVLLGAWASIKHQPQTILDVGAGTGVIALQLAQRSLAETIEAIEIDDDAFEQCTDNFENSDWGDRLFCYHAALQEFTEEMAEDPDFEGYDLIVSNPPFHSPPLPAATPPAGANKTTEARKLARFTDALPFDHLLACVTNLLTDNGVFSVILPKKEEEDFIKLAKAMGLYASRIHRVKGHRTAEAKRSLIEFTFQNKEPHLHYLVIEEERHQYTDDYIALVKDFYLKM